MDILTKSKLVVKRIASGETKQPHTSRSLPSCWRQRCASMFGSGPQPPAPVPIGARIRLRSRRRPSQMTKYCHLKACASF